MYYYKNAGRVTKTYYGQKFSPGDVKSVPGYINDPNFVKVGSSAIVTTTKSSVDRKASNNEAVSSENIARVDKSTSSTTSTSKKQDAKSQKSAQEVKKGDKVDG